MSDQFVAVLLSVVLIALVVRGLLWQQVKNLRARNWPTTQGRIESGAVFTHRTRYGRYYVVQLAYSYTVSGEYYSGYFEKTFLREKSAHRFVDGTKGLMVFVRHKAATPDISALLKSDQLGGWPS